MRVAGCIAIAAGMLTGVCQAQVFSDVDFKGTAVEGLHLYGISANSGYSSSASPTNGFQLGQVTGTVPLKSNINYGANISVGWQRHRQKTNITAFYSLTYAGSSNYSALNALNHSLTIGLNRILTSKWTFSLSASGQDNTLAQLVYQPSALSVLSQVPASINNLGAAFSVGQFSDSLAASTLAVGATSALNSPVASSLVGDRVLSYGTTASFEYTPTERWGIHFAAVSAGGQAQTGNQNNGTPQQNYLAPHNVALNAGVGFSYALSPRTQINFGADSVRSMNANQGAYSTSATAGLGRKMGEHWFLHASAGLSRNIVIHQISGTPQTQQVVGTGSLGYQTHAMTFLASYNRSSSDSSGLGVGTNTSSSGSWSWRRPSARWSVFSSFGFQEMANTGFASFSGWSFSTGLNEVLAANMRLSAQYVYFRSSGTYLGQATSVSVNSIRLTVGWSPQAVQPQH